jgi:hypothetical protein
LYLQIYLTTGEIFYNTTALPTGATDFKTVVSSSAWFAQSPTTTQHGDGAGAGPDYSLCNLDRV